MYDLLKGLTVIECGSFIAAPSCGLHLAQMGADVIRIDSIGGGPDARRWPRANGGASLYWEGLNKAKRSVALDLSRPEGRELLLALASAPGDGGGLFVTNFPPDGFLSYERLKARRSDTICLRVMGWPDGRPAVDYTVNAAVGVPLMTGPAEDLEPVNHVLPAWDLMTGAYAAFALLAAERARRADGRGREIRLPLSDVAIWTMGALGQIAEVSAEGRDRERTGNDLFGAFGRDFVTSEGRRLMVVAITARQWSGLVKVLALQEAVAALERELNVDFASDEGLRFIHRERLIPLFEAAFARRTADDLAPAFEAAGVCWSSYRSLTEALRDEPAFTAANPMLGQRDHPSGRYLTPDALATVAGQAREAEQGAPILGRDTDRVLAGLLGLNSREIGRLHEAGLVAGPTK